MEDLTRFCRTCNVEREIVSIIKDEQGEIYKLSCGHSDIVDIFRETVYLTERVDDELSRDGKTIEKGVSKAKTGIVTKRPSRDHLNFDWTTRTKYHKVEEQQDDGTWVIVHEHREPFAKKKPK